MNSIIKLENIEKKYGKKTVVDIEDLQIEKNSIFALIGPNGAGKSTSMKMICGLTSPSRGKIIINNKELKENNRIEILKNIGSLIEAPAFYENLSAYENLDIVRQYKDLDKSSINEVLSIVGLQNQNKKKAKEFSLGMKQRLAIAMALIGFPPILILDEPTNGLDPQAMAEIRNLIISLPERFDTSVMISSHALDEIEKMAQSIAIIGDGKIMYQGKIEDFKSSYHGQIRIQTNDNEKLLLLLKNYRPKLENKDLVLPPISNKEISKIVKLALDNNLEIYRITEKSKSLEELFIDFTIDKHL